MREIDDRTSANMEVVLEQVCRPLAHGGDHEIRKRIARKLIESARKGNTTLGGLTMVAKNAFELEVGGRFQPERRSAHRRPYKA
jgi:hypothetical protein